MPWLTNFYTDSNALGWNLSQQHNRIRLVHLEQISRSFFQEVLGHIPHRQSQVCAWVVWLFENWQLYRLLDRFVSMESFFAKHKRLDQSFSVSLCFPALILEVFNVLMLIVLCNPLVQLKIRSFYCFIVPFHPHIKNHVACEDGSFKHSIDFVRWSPFCTFASYVNILFSWSQTNRINYVISLSLEAIDDHMHSRQINTRTWEVLANLANNMLQSSLHHLFHPTHPNRFNQSLPFADCHQLHSALVYLGFHPNSLESENDAWYIFFFFWNLFHGWCLPDITTGYTRILQPPKQLHTSFA